MPRVRRQICEYLLNATLPKNSERTGSRCFFLLLSTSFSSVSENSLTGYDFHAQTYTKEFEVEKLPQTLIAEALSLIASSQLMKMQETAEFECSRRQNPRSALTSTVKLKVGSYFSHQQHLFFNFLLKSCSARVCRRQFGKRLRASIAALRSHHYLHWEVKAFGCCNVS
jgi:hypothetical protein